MLTRQQTLLANIETIPESCLESACHIIQCFAGEAKHWETPDDTTKGIGVWAVFGNKMICVNRVSDLADKLTGVSDFETLVKYLRRGRGIILANCTNTDSKYNMHLGAVLSDGPKIVLSDLSESNDEKIAMVSLEKNCIETTSSNVLAAFRGKDYRDPDTFKFGLLISEKDHMFKELHNLEHVDEPVSEEQVGQARKRARTSSDDG